MTDPVLVTGASGFLGRHVVQRLQAAGIPVRVLVRRPLPTWEKTGTQVQGGDIRDLEAVRQAVRGSSAVVHLAACLRDEPESEAVNVGGAVNLVEACRQEGVHRVIVISTQSTKIPRQGIYARTKASADRIFRDSQLDWTILYPSVVYGESLEGVFGALYHIIERSPIVPVLGNGRWRSAPVSVEDVATLVKTCLDSPRAIGREYDVAGAEVLTLDELLDRIAIAAGESPRRKAHVPFALALLAARILARLQRTPAITVSNVLGSNQDTVIDIAPARQELGFRPQGLDEGMRAVFREIRHRKGRAEGRSLGNYLAGESIPDDLVERYCAARERLLPDPMDRVSAFARRHPWAASLLDAATALGAPRHRFRQRVLVMAAILEATPRYADLFIQRTVPRTRAWLTLIAAGLRTAGRALVGVPLLLVLGIRAE